MELIRGNHNYLKCNSSTLFRLRIISHKDKTILNCLSTSYELHQKCWQEEKSKARVRRRKYRDKIDYFQFLHFSILYRAFHSFRHPLALFKGGSGRKVSKTSSVSKLSGNCERVGQENQKCLGWQVLSRNLKSQVMKAATFDQKAAFQSPHSRNIPLAFSTSPSH